MSEVAGHLQMLPAPGEIHLWTLWRQSSANTNELLSILSDVERRRAERLRVGTVRQAFIDWRAQTRRILSGYLGVGSRDLVIDVTAEGKPFIPQHCNPFNLAFNLAHRNEMALLAVTSNHEIGVDLECRDEQLNVSALAAQALSASEVKALESLMPGERAIRLLRTWTCKEAFLKALGWGLTRPLHEIEIRWEVDESPQILTTGQLGVNPESWDLKSWSPCSGWFAALAAPKEHSAWTMQYRSLAPFQTNEASEAGNVFQVIAERNKIQEMQPCHN